MKNKEVAYLLYEIADILEILDVKFKPQAYRRAAQNIEGLGEAIGDLHRNGRLRDIPGIGEAIAEKIGEFLDSKGHLGYLDRLREQVPQGLLTLLEIPGLGPKKVSLLYKELGIQSIDDLKSACENHALEGIKGLGAKTEQNILKGIELIQRSSGRFLLHQALEDAEAIKAHLAGIEAVEQVELAGSLRRMKETVGDIDILVTSKKPKEVMGRFVSYGDVAEVQARGETKSSIRLSDGIHVDIRVVPEDCFGAAMQYFTGSKEHNVKVRKHAISKGLKINEYGVFTKDTDEKIAGSNEKKVYNALGLAFIPPELREDRGEIELAEKNKLPKIIELSDIKGDLHVHSDWSDGNATIEDIVEISKERGYSFLAVCDHSESMKFAGGLSSEKLLQQNAKIKEINDGLKNFKVFSSLECNIRTDGKLDINPKVVKELDFISIAVHSNFNMDEKKMTNRIISAMGHEKVRVLAHPTGRLIQKREPYKVNLEKIVEAAVENDVFLEINSFPDRLDLNDSNIKFAKEKGAKFTISTDSHRMNHLEFMRFGVACARRGWLECDDVINTKPLNSIMKILVK